MKPPAFYEVIVGNLGGVYRGTDKKESRKVYEHYAQQSKTGFGRARGRSVSLWKNGEIIAEVEEKEEG